MEAPKLKIPKVAVSHIIRLPFNISNIKNEKTFEEILNTKTKEELNAIALSVRTINTYMKCFTREFRKNDSYKVSYNMTEIENDILNISYDDYERKNLITRILWNKSNIKRHYDWISTLADNRNDSDKYQKLTDGLKENYGKFCGCGYIDLPNHTDGVIVICNDCHKCNECTGDKKHPVKCINLECYNHVCNKCECDSYGYCKYHYDEYHNCYECDEYCKKMFHIVYKYNSELKNYVCCNCVNKEIDRGTKRKLPIDIVNLISSSTYDAKKIKV